MTWPTNIQGEPLKSTPPKSLYNFWHLEKFWASFDGILYLENLGEVDFSGSPCKSLGTDRPCKALGTTRQSETQDTARQCEALGTDWPCEALGTARQSKALGTIRQSGALSTVESKRNSKRRCYQVAIDCCRE